MAEIATAGPPKTITLLLTGDVMTGRGIDQILSHPGDPALHESHATSALDYVALAERAHGPIPRRVAHDYVWGDALAEIARRHADVRLVNLETAITARGAPEPKGINYRMHPGNVGVLSAAGIQACVLANNHVLDWGAPGLLDTLDALQPAGIGVAGAGRNEQEASVPLALPVPDKGRVLVLALGCRSSGIPPSWRARTDGPGVNLLSDLSRASVRRIVETVTAVKRPGDVVVVSIHWGDNWGYDISDQQRDFAHGLIEEAMVDVVHGHSSHHPKAIEVYHGKLVLYGCGDLIDDYEGINGYDQYRDDLVLMYFASVLTEGGALHSLDMVPFLIRKFRLQRAGHDDAAWLAATLSRESAGFSTRSVLAPDDTLQLQWT